MASKTGLIIDNQQDGYSSSFDDEFQNSENGHVNNDSPNSEAYQTRGHNNPFVYSSNPTTGAPINIYDLGSSNPTEKYYSKGSTTGYLSGQSQTKTYCLEVHQPVQPILKTVEFPVHFRKGSYDRQGSKDIENQIRHSNHHQTKHTGMLSTGGVQLGTAIDEVDNIKASLNQNNAANLNKTSLNSYSLTSNDIPLATLRRKQETNIKISELTNKQAKWTQMVNGVQQYVSQNRNIQLEYRTKKFISLMKL